MSTRLNSGDIVPLIGGSITECGRKDDRFKPLGFGFAGIFCDMLLAREPEKRVTILNRGIRGNTIDDLRNRWSDDALIHSRHGFSLVAAPVQSGLTLYVTSFGQ